MQKISIKENKARFIENLLSTERKGVENLIRWLEDSDFFYAPASINHHLACAGGLCLHSNNVTDVLLNKIGEYYSPQNPLMGGSSFHTLAISAKLTGSVHDVCKANFYAPGAEHPANDGQLYILKKNSVNLHLASLEDKARFLKYCYDSNGEIKLDIAGKTVGKLITWLTNSCAGTMPETPEDYHVNDRFPLGHGEKSLSIVQQFIELTDEEKLAIRWHMGNFDLSPYGEKAYRNAQKYSLVNLLFIADFEACNMLECES